MFTALAGRTSSGKRRAPNSLLGKEVLDLLEVSTAALHEAGRYCR
jgi:hypothetical protein